MQVAVGSRAEQVIPCVRTGTGDQERRGEAKQSDVRKHGVVWKGEQGQREHEQRGQCGRTGEKPNKHGNSL